MEKTKEILQKELLDFYQRAYIDGLNHALVLIKQAEEKEVLSSINVEAYIEFYKKENNK